MPKQNTNSEINVGTGRKIANLFLYPPTPCIILIVVLLLLFSLIAPGFATLANFQAIVIQVAYIGVIALGLNFVILLGEIDVSVAVIMLLSAYAFSIVTIITDQVFWGVTAALIAGAIYGTVNGLLVAKLQLISFIATLATKFMVRALLLIYCGGGAFKTNVDLPENVKKVTKMLAMGTIKVPSEQRWLSVGKIFGISVSVYILLIVLLVILMISKNTNWGRNVFALGGNKRAAVVAGIPVHRTKILAYTICGLCCGLGGVLYICQSGTIQPMAANGGEMNIIAACAIGGTSMSGGRGAGISPFAGAILIGIILNATSVMAISGSWQDFFIGAIVLLSVVFDIIRRKVVDNIYV